MSVHNAPTFDNQDDTAAPDDGDSCAYPSSEAADSDVFDFDRFYGTNKSDDGSQNSSARPESCTRPDSCGFVMTGDDKESENVVEQHTESSDSAWWSRSVLGADTDSSVSSTERDPFENDTLDDEATTPTDPPSEPSAQSTSELVAEKHSAVSVDHLPIAQDRRLPQSTAFPNAIPQIQIVDCEGRQEGAIPQSCYETSTRELCMRQYQKVVPRSAVVSFAAEESIITFDSSDYDQAAAAPLEEPKQVQQTPRQSQTCPEPSRRSLKPASTAISRQSMTVLPGWASVYYKRGSTCLTQLARRSTLKWSARHDDSEESESLVNNPTPIDGIELPSRVSIVRDRAVTRPMTAHMSRASKKSTVRASSRISELSWKPELKQAIEVPVKTHFEQASFTQTCDEDDSRTLRKVILLFSLGFLFPPLWFWGLLTTSSNTPKTNLLAMTGVYAGHYSERKIHQWRLACAVMLGVTVLMIAICAIVALTMKDFN